MRVALPGWVNVVLEGGGLELERALVAYRQLDKHLQRDWRPRAAEVQALAQQIIAHEHEVNRVEERARRRAALSAMTELDSLTRAVSAARAQLAQRLGVGSDSLTARLTELENQAADDAHLQRAWDRFRLERLVFTVVSLPMCLGFVRSTFPLALALAFAVPSSMRLASWEWLGVRTPKIRYPLLAGVLTLGGALALGAAADLAIIIGLVSTALSCWSLIGWSLWSPSPIKKSID